MTYSAGVGCGALPCHSLLPPYASSMCMLTRGQRANSNIRTVFFVTARRRGVRHGTELRYPGRAEHQAHAGAAGPLPSEPSGGLEWL